MKFHENSAFRLSFLRKSASQRVGEFRRSAEKLLEFRIPRQIFFKIRCSANPDDPRNNDVANALSGIMANDLKYHSIYSVERNRQQHFTHSIL